MHYREDPSDTQIGRLTFFLFAHFFLMMYSQWWRVQVRDLGWAEVPLAPWALSGLLTAAAWGGIAYYAATLSMRKLHKWMIRFPIAMAILSIADYVVFLTSVSLSDMNGILTFVFFMMLLPYYALYVVFYIPLAGLAQLVPFLGARMANANVRYVGPIDPIAAVVMCLVYLSISIHCHTLGIRARERAENLYNDL